MTAAEGSELLPLDEDRGLRVARSQAAILLLAAGVKALEGKIRELVSDLIEEMDPTEPVGFSRAFGKPLSGGEAGIAGSWSRGAFTSRWQETFSVSSARQRWPRDNDQAVQRDDRPVVEASH